MLNILTIIKKNSLGFTTLLTLIIRKISILLVTLINKTKMTKTIMLVFCTIKLCKKHNYKENHRSKNRSNG